VAGAAIFGQLPVPHAGNANRWTLQKMTIIILLINLAALTIIIRRGLPQPFAWNTSVLLAIILLLGGLVSPLGGIERGVGFVTLLSSLIVTWYSMRWLGNIAKVFYAFAVLLTIFILMDAFRLIPTLDVTMTTGETFNLIRRPYLFEHPNVKACWLLLLSLSPISLIGILVTQSRGAFMGYIAALVRFVPKRWYVQGAVFGVTVVVATSLLRPGTFFGRVDLWRAGFDLFMSQPLFGHGTGTYLALAKNGMATAHNAVLTIAAENGLIGLCVFILWVITTSTLVMRSSHVMKYGLLAFSVQQMVDDQWLHPVTAILLGMVIAICIFANEKEKQNGNNKSNCEHIKNPYAGYFLVGCGDSVDARLIIFSGSHRTVSPTIR
jgi:hypothetical protein